jgi:hypothetical protein
VRLAAGAEPALQGQGLVDIDGQQRGQVFAVFGLLDQAQAAGDGLVVVGGVAKACSTWRSTSSLTLRAVVGVDPVAGQADAGGQAVQGCSLMASPVRGAAG